MSFEISNNETYKKMIELTLEKQNYVNPIVNRFLRLNMNFFKKTFNAFNEIRSMDVDSKKNYTDMYNEA